MSTIEGTSASTASASGSAALMRVAGLAAIASGFLGIFMVGTLIAMFGGFAIGARSTALSIGAVNDALAIVVYGLVLPVIPAMHVFIMESGNVRSLALATLGAVGIVVTMVLQWLLVSGAMTFEQQIGPVSVALLAVGAWMAGTGYLAAKAGVLPRGLRNGLLGALYVGYPVWAISIGRTLVARGRREA